MRSPQAAIFVAGVLSVVLSSARPVQAQDVSSFEKRVTVKVLSNGLTILVCERHEAPVFSFFTHVDVGGDREYPGITGLAHMFEHMAFKGTDKIGTTNWPAEKVALAKVEATYAAYDRERRREHPRIPRPRRPALGQRPPPAQWPHPDLRLGGGDAELPALLARPPP